MTDLKISEYKCTHCDEWMSLIEESAPVIGALKCIYWCRICGTLCTTFEDCDTSGQFWYRPETARNPKWGKVEGILCTGRRNPPSS